MVHQLYFYLEHLETFVNTVIRYLVLEKSIEFSLDVRPEKLFSFNVALNDNTVTVILKNAFYKY